MWIEMHDSARDHPKVLKLARVLGTSQVVTLGHITSLWLWTLRMAPDGDLSSFDSEDIEIGAQWDGEPGKFVEAAVAKNLLDLVDGSYSIHDWQDYSGSLKSADRKRKERERKAAYRAKKAEEAAAKESAIKAKVDEKIKLEAACVPGTIRGHSEKSDPVTQNDRPTDRPYTAPSGTTRSEPKPTNEEPVVVSIPVVGGKEYGVTQAQIDEWAETFTGVDVLQEVKEARAWCNANPTKRKTARGVPKFLVGWLSREQDRGGKINGFPSKTQDQPQTLGYLKPFGSQTAESID